MTNERLTNMSQFGGTIVPIAHDSRAFPVETGLSRTDTVARSSYQVYNPIGGNLADGAATFELQTGVGELLDLSSSYFTAQVRLEEQDANGANPASPQDSTSTITPTILATHAKFSRISLSVNGRDIVDEYSAGAYPYIVLARDSLVSPGPSTVPRGWEEFEFWILPGPDEPNNALAAAAAANGTVAAAAAAQAYGNPVTEANVQAGTAAVAADLIRFNSAATARRRLIFAPGTARNTTDGAYFTIGFRPRGTLWETGQWLPDNLRMRIQFQAATHQSMMCMGNGVADGTNADATRSGAAPTMTFKANTFQFQARVIQLKDSALATLNAYRDGAAGGVPRPLVYPYTYVRVAERTLTAAGAVQFSGIFGGVLPDLVTIVPCFQAAKARSGTIDTGAGAVSAIQFDPFDTAGLNSAGTASGCLLTSDNSDGAGFLQVTVNGTSYPRERIITHVQAYQQYCEACAHSGFLTGSTAPALSFRQWKKRPVYCVLIRDDGEAPWGRATEMERKGTVTLNVSPAGLANNQPVTLHIMGWSQAAAEFSSSGSVNLVGVGGSETS